MMLAINGLESPEEENEDSVGDCNDDNCETAAPQQIQDNVVIDIEKAHDLFDDDGDADLLAEAQEALELPGKKPIKTACREKRQFKKRDDKQLRQDRCQAAPSPSKKQRTFEHIETPDKDPEPLTKFRLVCSKTGNTRTYLLVAAAATGSKFRLCAEISEKQTCLHREMMEEVYFYIIITQ